MNVAKGAPRKAVSALSERIATSKGTTAFTARQRLHNLMATRRTIERQIYDLEEWIWASEAQGRYE